MKIALKELRSKLRSHPGTGKERPAFVRIFFWLFLIAVLSQSCMIKKSVYKPKELWGILEERLDEDELEIAKVPFEIEPEVKEMANMITHNQTTDYSRAVTLVDAIIDMANLNVKYDRWATRSAMDVLKTGSANCLSFTNLFVAMAREVGLKAVFVEVYELSSTFDEGDVIVHSSHICAGLFYDAGFALIDFASEPRKEYVRYRVIDDLEAAANFFNNLGYECSRNFLNGSGDGLCDRDSIEFYKVALKIKPDFAKAWSNLGAAYTHKGLDQKALKTLRKALEYDPDFAEAHVNIGNLYYKDGRFKKAEEHYRAALKHGEQVYYYNFLLGMVHLRQDEPDKAAKYFRRSIRRRRNNPGAFNGLGMSFFAKGELGEARKFFLKAIELDPDHEEASKNLKILELKQEHEKRNTELAYEERL